MANQLTKVMRPHQRARVLAETDASQVERPDPGVGGLNFCSSSSHKLLRDVIIKISGHSVSLLFGSE